MDSFEFSFLNLQILKIEFYLTKLDFTYYNMEHHTESTISNQYSLSIRIGSDGFSLSIIDDSNTLLSTKIVATVLALLSIEEIVILINKETEINYRNIRLVYESDIYQFVPAPVFRSNEAADYLNFQHKTTKNDIILFNYLPIWDTVNIFSIPKTIQTALNQIFPNTIIEQHISYFLTTKVKTHHDNSLYIWTRPKMMDIVVFKNGKLNLLNSYAYQTAEDFTYHALNIIDKLSIDTDSCKLNLFNAEKKPELQKTLEKYLAVNV